MEQTTFKYQTHVASDWVDYNGHMNDAAYALVFSHAVDAVMDYIGLHKDAREALAYTIFTLETHICYLREAHEGEQLDLTVQLIDTDAKRLHVFFTMKNRTGDLVATSEQLLMGIDTEQGKAAPFPTPVAAFIANLAEVDRQLASPKQVGRSIGIRR